MIQRLFNILTSFLLVYLLVMLVQLKEEVAEINRPPTKLDVVKLEQPEFLLKSPEEGLWEALDYYGVEHKEIVYAQAILETGHFRSKVYLKYNNLFGLYNSYIGDYYSFKHWSESVTAYLRYIQYRYKPPNDYYKFLNRIGYAEDTNYTHKLKKLVRDGKKLHN